MRHIEEHILELYVLNSNKVSKQRGEIDAHLAACEGCRALVEQMSVTYQRAEERFNELNQRGDIPAPAAIRLRTNTPDVRAMDATPVSSYRPVTRGQQITYFVRRHPVIVGGSSFLVFAGLALLGTLLFRPEPLADKNPAFVHYNPGADEVEILNRNSQLLWRVPSRGLSGVKDVQPNAPQTLIADIDGDGVNEVLTTLWTPEDAPNGHSSFKAYGRDGSLHFKVQFDGEITYLARTYPNVWSSTFLAVDNPDSSGRRAILVGWQCNRSPWVLTRIDSKGNILGEFWHFGVISAMSLMDVNGDGRNELILMGQNNVLDSVGGEFPAIAVLDPRKIVGPGASVVSSGFRLPLSEAEIYYVRLPVSPLSKALFKYECVSRLVHYTKDVFSFWVANGYETAPNYADLEYLFSRDFRVLQVKSSSETEAVFKRAVQDHKITGKIDTEYLEDLKNGVQYWDGEEWRTEVTKVQHKHVAMK